MKRGNWGNRIADDFGGTDQSVQRNDGLRKRAIFRGIRLQNGETVEPTVGKKPFSEGSRWLSTVPRQKEN